MGEQTYDEAEIKGRLEQLLPQWTYEDGHLQRRYRTAGWKASLLLANAVGHLAEAAWHHPDLVVSYASVTVRLMNHAAKGITDKDFELAKKIEDLAQWQPSEDSGALEGTPQDPRYAYIKYD